MKNHKQINYPNKPTKANNCCHYTLIYQLDRTKLPFLNQAEDPYITADVGVPILLSFSWSL